MNLGTATLFLSILLLPSIQAQLRFPEAVARTEPVILRVPRQAEVKLLQ